MEDLFEKGGVELDPEELVQTIDIGAIDDEAMQLAMDMVSGLSEVYFDQEFMKENPSLKKRIDFFIDGMRLLLKIRKSSEKTHDILVNAIAANSNNASLYLAQARNEGNLLSIQKQIDETINSLSNLLKGYQLEINFNQQQSQQVDEETGEISSGSQSVHRGSKTFIQQMRSKNTQVDPAQTELFSDTEEETLES